MKKFKSESGHWYTKEGEPMYTIVGANGKERNTNLRDAKSLGLVPSVTTVIAMIAKPSLENWKMNQVLNSAISLQRKPNESVEAELFAHNHCIVSKGLFKLPTKE